MNTFSLPFPSLIRWLPWCLVLLLIALYAMSLHGDSEDSLELLILAGGDAQGVLEPCGCTSGQLGGISRRDTLIAKLAKKNPGTTLILDKGGFILEPGRQSTIKAEFLLRAYSQIGTRILGLSPRDLFQGVDRVLALSEEQQVDLLCSNLKIVGREQAFQKFTTRTFRRQDQKIRVGVTAVIGQKAIEELGSQAYLSIQDPVTALRSFLHDLESKTDLLIALVHGREEEARRIARECPQIDLILFGHNADTPSFRPIQQGRTLLVSSGTMGKHLAIIRIQFDADMRRKNVSLDLRPLDKNLGESDRMEQLLQRYQQRITDLQLLEKRSPPPHPEGSYTGSKSCQPCHESEYRTWKQTAHSHAYETLVQERHAQDPECAVCHSTGFHYAGGFVSPAKTPHLQHVGCESCHGPGRSHTELPRQNPMKPTEERTCRSCHNATQTPHFDFKTFFERIKH